MPENLLELAGRGITSTVAGAAAPPNANQQRARGTDMMKDVGIGGAMLGGGTAAVVAALSLLSSLRKEREMEDDNRLDDDTLYISDPHEAKKRVKAASESTGGVSPMLAPGLALTSGIVGAGAGYALVQGVWNAIEKRRRQKLLDEAQRETMDMADTEAIKAAAAQPGSKINLADLLTASPVALPLLTMLATGGLTYAALNKSFPTIDKPKRVGPRRIRVGKDVAPYEVPEEDAEELPVKSAFHQEDLADAGNEFLASFVAASRRGTITGDLIHKSASGELDAMEDLLKSAGVDALLLSLKGASDRPLPQDLRMLGTMALFKSAALKDTARAIVAAEYLEIYGDTYNEISGCPKTMQKMASLGCLMGVISRDSALPEMAKQAAAMENPNSSGLLAMLKALLSGGGAPAQAAGGQHAPGSPQGGDHLQREERDAALTSDAGGGIGGVSEDGADGGPVAKESTGDDDVIDSVLATNNPASVLAPSD